MQRHETFLELVEQAACGINMLDTTNPSELEALLSTVSQINEQISHISEGPSELLERVKGSGASVFELLGGMIKGNAMDLDMAIQAVTQEVCIIQKFADSLSKMPEEDPQSSPMQAAMPWGPY